MCVGASIKSVFRCGAYDCGQFFFNMIFSFASDTRWSKSEGAVLWSERGRAGRRSGRRLEPPMALRKEQPREPPRVPPMASRKEQPMALRKEQPMVPPRVLPMAPRKEHSRAPRTCNSSIIPARVHLRVKTNVYAGVARMAAIVEEFVFHSVVQLFRLSF